MRFIVFGDSKGKENGINKKILHSLLKESSKLIPSADFIVVLGDSIAGSNDSNILLTQVNDFRNIVASYYENTPLIPVIGNHEVNINPIDDTIVNIFISIISSSFLTIQFRNKTIGNTINTVTKRINPTSVITIFLFFTPSSSPLILHFIKNISKYNNSSKFITTSIYYFNANIKTKKEPLIN